MDLFQGKVLGNLTVSPHPSMSPPPYCPGSMGLRYHVNMVMFALFMSIFLEPEHMLDTQNVELMNECKSFAQSIFRDLKV